jgi:hypothetical protein
MAQNRKPGLMRRAVGLPVYIATHPHVVAWKTVKIAVVGTAIAGAALYLYTAFSPKYEKNVSQPAGIEKIANDASNACEDISSYVAKEISQSYGK